MTERNRVKRASSEGMVPRNGLGIVPTSFAVRGPSKTVPRIDYERIFVLDEEARFLGEYALRDDCPLEFEDLQRAIPVSGLRHLQSLNQGEYAFTPFRVENLWFVVLSRGLPRIEERGSIGTLLAAVRVHLPGSLSPSLAARESSVGDRERTIDAREACVSWREEQVTERETGARVAETKPDELETEVRALEARLNPLRDSGGQKQQPSQRVESEPELSGEPVDKPRRAETTVDRLS